MASTVHQTGFFASPATVILRLRDDVERWLAAERESLILWLPVAFGAGISAWFLLPGPAPWAGFMLFGGGLAVTGLIAGPRQWRHGAVILIVGLAMMLGCATIWARSQWVAAPVLAGPVVVEFGAMVERVEPLPARRQVRMVLLPDRSAGLPERIRVTARAESRGVARVQGGDAVRLRARLVPPPRAALPGGYDFAQRAWFNRIGAVGTLLGPIARDERFGVGEPGLRARLANHVRAQVPGSAGAIAATLATGDRGGISPEDDEAMRRSGLAHLLSISGLHISAMVAGTMWMLMRLLALSPWLALRWPLTLVAAGGGALAGLGYTLLTGGEVPTIRSLIAALLVLAALAIGREAISMRLLGAGAMVVMLLWPEALTGPSFQLSFAAVASIIALHSHPTVAALFRRRDEGFGWRLMRGLGALLATGLVVELALMPIALFHFHKAGLYGAFANMVAIPLTTFVVMPAEALALMLDTIGAGAPAWWVVGLALDVMLWMAHAVANAPGAVATIPTMPALAFALCAVGGCWVLLWRRSHRWYGLVAVAAGLVWTSLVPPPDVLITGDGRHVAIRTPEGRYALLRETSGDFARAQLAEAAGVDTAMAGLADLESADCSPDFCVWTMRTGDRRWTMLAARSNYRTPWQSLVNACAAVDIAIADRPLPRACRPRWFKADRWSLRQSGGLAISFDPPRIMAARTSSRNKPWDDPPTIRPPRPAAARAPGSVSDSAATARPVAPAP